MILRTLSIFLPLLAFYLASPSPAVSDPSAAPTLVCPTTPSGTPSLRYATGVVAPIADPQLGAVALKACSAAPVSTSTVQIVNQRYGTLYVNFTTKYHTPGAIVWGAGCGSTGSVGAIVRGGTTCSATVTNDTASTRFCASLQGLPTDCFEAQANHLTMIETIFLPSCFSLGSCVYYDISVIPSNCTDALWASSQCAGTGGASYNVPVSLSCPQETTLTCQGPVSGQYGSANYPANCGNPNATCLGGANCLNAYFYPMFDPPENKYQPTLACPRAATLTITFVKGP